MTAACTRKTLRNIFMIHYPPEMPLPNSRANGASLSIVRIVGHWSCRTTRDRICLVWREHMR